MRILLIEDDRALCTALLPALQAAGYTVDTCHDGADGKTLLCGGAYDVCVLDRMLPGLDGLSLLRAARAKGCRLQSLRNREHLESLVHLDHLQQRQ